METSQSASEQSESEQTSNSQPTNPPISLGPNNKAFVVRKLAFLKRIICILEAVGLVVGLAAVILIIYGVVKAGHFNYNSTLHGWSKRCHSSESERCELNTYFKGRLCEKEGKYVKQCVEPLLVVIPMIINCLLVVYASLGQVLSKREYKKKDMYVHWVASLIAFASGLSVISFCIQVSLEDLCGESNLKAKATDYVINEPWSYGHGSPSPEDDMNQSSLVLANLTEVCPEMQREKYSTLYFIFGGLVSVLLGILYIGITVVFMKGASQAQAVAPMPIQPETTTVANATVPSSNANPSPGSGVI